MNIFKNENKNKTLEEKYIEYIKNEEVLHKNILLESIKFYFLFIFIIFIIFIIFKLVTGLLVFVILGLYLIYNKFIAKKNLKDLFLPIKYFEIKNKKTELENLYLTDKNQKFLRNLEQLNNLNQKISDIKEELNSLKNINDKELTKQSELLSKTLDNYEKIKVDLKEQILEFCNSKVFVLDIKSLYDITTLNEYEKELLNYQIYFPFMFYVKELKNLIRKYFFAKKEKINNKIEVYILKY